jgi:hypothetical protein
VAREAIVRQQLVGGIPQGFGALLASALRHGLR